MKAAVLLALAAAGYAVAAWAVAPGFYDGIGPVQPYNWVSPPPEFARVKFGRRINVAKSENCRMWARLLRWTKVWQTTPTAAKSHQLWVAKSP